MQIIEEALQQSQELHEPVLTPADRRLLLGASLRVLGHRYFCGQPILMDDVIRVASLADDAAMRS